MKCIYVRTNLVNGKQYVGQTVDFKSREREWRCYKAEYAGDYINNARKKYGIENWSVEILKVCGDEDDLNKLEEYYIKKLNTRRPFGYNLTDGGYGNKGHIVTETTKQKISETLKGKYVGEKSWTYGRKLTEVQKQHLREIHLGKKLSEEHKKKIGEGNKGKKISEETRKKMSEARKGKEPWSKGKHLSEETRKKLSEANKGKNHSSIWKKIFQYSKDGVLLSEWKCAKEAADTLNCSQHHICECCNGKRKTHGGYKWSYESL